MNKKSTVIAIIVLIIILYAVASILEINDNEPRIEGLNVAFRQDIQDNEINSTFEKINFNVKYTWERSNFNDRYFEGRRVVWVFIYWGTPMAGGGRVGTVVPEHVAKKWQSELESQSGVVHVDLIYNP